MIDPIKIKIKRGLTAGNAPSVLSFGELAVNTFDRTLFVGGITGGVQDYPLQKTYVYNTYTDFVADIDAGIYGTAGDESHFQYGDLFIERNTRLQYGFLPSTSDPASVGIWSALSATIVESSSSGSSGFAPILETAPSPIVDGAFWFNTDTGVLYTGYVGASGSYWVQSTILNNPSNYT